MMPYYVGIDGGGTKTAVELRTRGSAAHSRAVFGPLNCNSDRTAAAKTLTDTLAWLAAQPEGLAGCDGLCIGSAGISNPDAYNFIQDIIRAGGYTGPLQIVGDQVTALAGALGQPVGTVLIAGTGSICYARTADGREARSGGWGSLMDDEGGGFALGRDALAAADAQMLAGFTAQERETLTALHLRMLDNLTPGDSPAGDPFERLGCNCSRP